MKISIDNIDAFVFDFDGVLTNNLVQMDENGTESVSCSRADGLAFDVLKKLNKPAYILSTEKNLVVSGRARKLNIPALQGINNKSEAILELTSLKGYSLENIFYVGNDLNDYFVMQLCGYTACPADSHPEIKDISGINLDSKGGHGVVRELLEEVLGLDFIKTLYKT
jgi:3-deoxy-D-manno-octulosonate 8-phosphate phosphatase (KDO 8-P phosphatase)